MSEKLFGLIGKNIGYSFSRNYFSEKFEANGLTDYSYVNFDIPHITHFLSCVEDNPNLKGLNVTIPYKESIIPFLDELSEKAEEIGAVNTIAFTSRGTLKGYNTDFYGFIKAIQPLLESHHEKALIIGTGGASKAVAYALEQLDIEPFFVSRNAGHNILSYDQLDKEMFESFDIIVNATPLGTSPNIDECPAIPYEYFSAKQIAFDLIYNPEETLFLKKAKQQGAVTKNGLDMLIYQAERAWEIWNK